MKKIVFVVLLVVIFLAIIGTLFILPTVKTFETTKTDIVEHMFQDDDVDVNVTSVDFSKYTVTDKAVDDGDETLYLLDENDNGKSYVVNETVYSKIQVGDVIYLRKTTRYMTYWEVFFKEIEILIAILVFAGFIVFAIVLLIAI